MLTQPPILPLRDEVMAAADQRQKHDGVRIAVMIMLLPSYHALMP